MGIDFSSAITSLEWAVKDLLKKPANDQFHNLYAEIMEILVDEDFQNTYLKKLYYRDLKIHALRKANLTETQKANEYAEFLLDQVNSEIITNCLNKGIDLKKMLGNVIMGRRRNGLTRAQRMQVKHDLMVLKDKLGDKVDNDIEAFVVADKVVTGQKSAFEEIDTLFDTDYSTFWKENGYTDADFYKMAKKLANHYYLEDQDLSEVTEFSQKLKTFNLEQGSKISQEIEKEEMKNFVKSSSDFLKCLSQVASHEVEV